MSQVFDESNSKSPNLKFAVSLPNLDQVLSPSKQLNNPNTPQQHSRLLPVFFEKLIRKPIQYSPSSSSNTILKEQKKDNNILEHLDEYGLW